MSRAKLQCGVEGWFHVVHRGRDGTIKFESKFKNLIMDQGLNDIATRNIDSATNACVLLADNTIPIETETAQDTNWSNRSSNSVRGYLAGDGPEHRARVRQVFDFSPSSGSFNISSIGVGHYTNNANSRRLFSRALVLDENENPTTISILEGDYVQVTYDLYLYPSLDDVTGTITLDGDIGGQYDYIVRVCNVDRLSNSAANDIGTRPNLSMNSTASGTGFNAITSCYTGDIGPVDGLPFGSSNTTATNTSTVWFTYVEDSFSVRRRYRRGLRSNPINIRTAVHRLGPFCYQTQFDPPIPKTTADILDLTYEVSWGRR